MSDQAHNLNPHKPALVAMMIWGAEYARQGGGVMDFWHSLSESRQEWCRESLERLLRARDEGGRDE